MHGLVRRGCALIVLAGLLGIALACALGAAGVSRGALKAPWFDQTLGPAHLVGYSTWNASCLPYTGCAPTRDESYVIWLLWHGQQGGPAYRLLSLPIDH